MSSSLLIAHLTCEYFANPICLDTQHPRLSWKLNSAARNARQQAYQIVVTDAGDGGAVIWDSGKVQSDQSVHVAYAGPALHSGQRCYWRVRVWDGDDQPSEWSETMFWEMGLLDNSEWQADWITPDLAEDHAPLLRRSFALDGEIKSARIYATSLGIYELHLNGQRVGDGLLTPGWTSYKNRLQYQVYDVTALLQSGDNAIGAMLGDGWHRGYLGFNGKREIYGDKLALLLQLHVVLVDGRTVVVTSDDQWKSSTGPITRADLYNGESYDARLELPGWAAPGFEDNAWHGVRQYDYPKDKLVAQIGPFVRRQERIKPVRLFKSPKGETIFDFGQNMVGWVQLKLNGEAGTTVTLHHAEVLDQAGNFYIENLRKAQQRVEYTLKGSGEETYEPRFTFMGFQFVQVDGWPGELTLESLTGIVVHSEIPEIGTFECSNPMINQLQHNIVWGQKGNFVDVPTDCPQRDERLGWTGDAQVFARTACFNRDVAAFFGKWLRDVAADQLASGSVAFVSPDVPMMPGMSGTGSTAWGDAAIICPWTVYLSYDDKGILETQYASMAAWVNFMREQAGEKYLWTTGFHFGDWLDFRGMALMPSPVTNIELVATAFFAYSTSQMQQIATILGKHEDAANYAQLAANIKKAFNAEFVAPNGRVGPNSQTAYTLALHFDLLPEKLRPLAAKRLAEEVRKADYHLTTGFVGTPYLCQVLSRFGYTDLAYELLNQESFPSWLYPVKKGATTIWERWDGIKPDGSFQDVSMNSFNHYSYGAIGEWLYRVVAGIEADPNEPGYRHVLIQPQPGGGLTHARATLQSPYGEVACAWQLSEKDMRLQVTVPPNTRATVRLPARSLSQVKEVVDGRGKALKAANSITSATAKGGFVTLEVVSGQYEFVTTGMNVAQANAGVRHVAGRLDRGTTLHDLLSNEATKAILVKHIGAEAMPGLQSPFVINTSLGNTPLRLPMIFTEERVQEIEGELIALKN